ncbi:hypothetical protein BDW02DRAFT_565086 [Decorospora gaudefroyi]|uniref:Uncharacterized protein n=1 Tax=Decorospora gaudefroyi TaxID=184978 RepID=A0A6A5KQ43_9PLEO|nr:hypothetical protein BDW02DRAFT_565086 [Decorospora gaudefroyi]
MIVSRTQCATGRRTQSNSFPIRARSKPRLNAEHERLHLDFDLVTCIPVGPLLQVIFGIFGNKNFSENPDACFEGYAGDTQRPTYWIHVHSIEQQQRETKLSNLSNPS